VCTCVTYAAQKLAVPASKTMTPLVLAMLRFELPETAPSASVPGKRAAALQVVMELGLKTRRTGCGLSPILRPENPDHCLAFTIEDAERGAVRTAEARRGHPRAPTAGPCHLPRHGEQRGGSEGVRTVVGRRSPPDSGAKPLRPRRKRARRGSTLQAFSRNAIGWGDAGLRRQSSRKRSLASAWRGRHLYIPVRMRGSLMRGTRPPTATVACAA
jgi:hypothetical protein